MGSITLGKEKNVLYNLCERVGSLDIYYQMSCRQRHQADWLYDLMMWFGELSITSI